MCDYFLHCGPSLGQVSSSGPSPRRGGSRLCEGSGAVRVGCAGGFRAGQRSGTQNTETFTADSTDSTDEIGNPQLFIRVIRVIRGLLKSNKSNKVKPSQTKSNPVERTLSHIEEEGRGESRRHNNERRAPHPIPPPMRGKGTAGHAKSNRVKPSQSKSNLVRRNQA